MIVTSDYTDGDVWKADMSFLFRLICLYSILIILSVTTLSMVESHATSTFKPRPTFALIDSHGIPPSPRYST